jgi:hypothetical protein
MSAQLGRVKLYASDRMDFVTEGEDEYGRKCWRTYVGMTKPNGEIVFYLETLAFSPPTDWDDSEPS